MDDVIFAHNGSYGCGSVLLWRQVDTVVASDVLRRRAHDNASAASYWLRGVLDDCGRRDYLSDERGAGGGACIASLLCYY